MIKATPRTDEVSQAPSTPARSSAAISRSAASSPSREAFSSRNALVVPGRMPVDTGVVHSVPSSSHSSDEVGPSSA